MHRALKELAAARINEERVRARAHCPTPVAGTPQPAPQEALSERSFTNLGDT